MRGIILALLLALASSDKSKNERLLNPAKTYVYAYEAILLNGLPENGFNKAGLKINLKIQLGSYGQKEFLAQVSDVDVKEYHGQWPKDPFTRSSKLTQIIEDQLKNPFRFQYSNGLVGDIFAADGVSNVVVNMIRGILNMLNVQVRKSENVYDLEEETLAGKCQTRYVIEPDANKPNSIIVVKSRDLDRCEDRAVKRIGMPFLEPSRASQQKSRHLRRLQTYTYRLRFKSNDAIIDEIRAKEQIQYALFHELYGAAVTEVRQVLSLKQIKSSSIREPSTQLDNRGGLKYRFGSEVLQMPVLLLKSKDIEAQVSETLQNLVQNNQQEVQENAPAKFLQLIQLLRNTRPENLPALLKQYSDRPQFKQWMLKAIPLIGTPESLMVVKKNIPNQSAQEAAMAITLAMHYTRANQHAIELAVDLLHDPKVQDSPVLRQASLLSYSTLINRYCAVSETCPDSVLQPLHDFAAEASSKGRIEDIILALKAMGNAGQIPNIKRILKFAPGFSASAYQLPVRVQVDAVLALRNVAKRDPKKVQEIWLQVILDRRAHTEARMAASAALLDSRPPAASVMMLALAIQKESKVNLQLSSFVYTYMKSLTRSTTPETRELNAACNLAIKILNPALDKLSMRYSKVFYLDGFNYPLMSGASAKVIIMNSPTTTIPVNVIFKIRGNFAGAATDIIEVAVRAEGLQEVLRKQNIAFNENSLRRNIAKIIRTLYDFRSLPSEVPIITSYVKVFGQEVHYSEATRETIQDIVKAVTEPGARYSIAGKLITKIIKKILGGIVGQWAHPVLLAEARHIIPTSMGLPLEMAIISSAVGNAAVNIDMKANPSPPSDVSIAQLLQSALQIHADITPSFVSHTIATMGVNTALVQSAVEFHAKSRAVTQAKVNIKFDGKEQNLKIEAEPIKQEKDILLLRTQALAVSRIAEELEAAKKSPIVPKGAEPNILQKNFERSGKTSAEAASMEGSSELTVKKYAYPGPGEAGQHQYSSYELFSTCIRVPVINIKVCFGKKGRSAAGRKHTSLYQLAGDHEVKLTVKPITDQKDGAIEKLQLEITAGSQAASKIIALADVLEKEGEHIEEPAALSRLRTILGIDNDMKATNMSLSHYKNKRGSRKRHAVVEAKTTKNQSSSSSSQSSSSSSSNAQHYKQHPGKQNSGQEPWNKQQKNNHHHHGSSSSSSSSSKDDSSSSSSSKKSSSSSSSSSDSSSSSHKGHGHGKSSRSSSSSSSSSGSSRHRNSQQQYRNKQRNSQEQYRQKQHKQSRQKLQESRFSKDADNESSESSRRPQTAGARFLGEHRSPRLVITVQAVRAGNKKQGYQAIVYTDNHSSRSKVQALVVDITKESRWRACIRGEIKNLQEAQAEVKWGQNCQQYKLAAKADIGRLGNQAALKLKVNWARVPSKLKSIGQTASLYAPGAAYLLGFSQTYQRNPSKQTTLVFSLANPRTMNLLFKMPQTSLYYEAFRLPFAITYPWKARPAEIQVPVWNVFTDIQDHVADRLQGRCLISDNKVTTLNDVSYQYSMPGSCAHVLAQDCSEEYKFLVKAKNSIENAAHKEINVQLGDFNIDLNTKSGKPVVMVNSIEITRLPYEPSEDMKIEEEDGKIVLSAPEYGIEKMYYDGVSTQILPSSFMRGKMCGLCGRYDDETEQEFRTPDGSAAKDADSFGHSWILAEEACSGSCKLKRSMKKIEKPEYEESKCYSIHPVLSCAEGCTPTSITPVSVSMHCRSSELEEGQILADLPEDITESFDAHTSCSCDSLKCAS
ncbi:vitellogenin-A2-like [Mantella aurantiaca]